MENNNIFEFEGVIIKPSKNGIYRCPFGCGRKDYPAPKWKTKNGIIKHLNNCSMKPSIVKAKNDKIIELELLDKQYSEIINSIKEEVISNLPYKIGDEIFYVKKIVVKDTHEWRGNRSVKVRYEQELKYVSIKDTIREINFYKPLFKPTIENAKDLIYFNNGIGINSLYNNYQEAIDASNKKTKANEDARNFASLCR